MSNDPIRITGVNYNAATQSFEAAVTVFGKKGTRTYACSIQAPITMSFADAADGLAVQAQRRYGARGGMHSTVATRHPSPRTVRRRFNPSRWLEELVGEEGRNAA
ncbi:MAG: orotidine 5-phosphate decarboxylase [Sulfitobacter sp.]|nr:orotidine 5-phosphate decarboxylase [Sulfitobacter sp.]